MTEIVAERDDFEALAQAWSRNQQLYREEIPASTGQPAPTFGFRLESFSDRFILTYWSDEPPRQQVNHLANEIVGMFDYGITKHLLFRGAISYGSFCQGSRSLVGPAVDEAYEWSNIAGWAGILCSPSARKAIDDRAQAGDRDLKGEFAKWSVPLSDGGTIDTWVVWWPRTGKRKQLIDLFLDPPVSRSVERKMTNTLKFCDWATKEFPVGVKDEP
jgi:hypothetical protein